MQPQDKDLTQDPIKKILRLLFSETTDSFEYNLALNVSWMALNKMYVYCGNQKSKMDATSGKRFNVAFYG